MLTYHHHHAYMAHWLNIDNFKIEKKKKQNKTGWNSRHRPLAEKNRQCFEIRNAETINYSTEKSISSLYYFFFLFNSSNCFVAQFSHIRLASPVKSAQPNEIYCHMELSVESWKMHFIFMMYYYLYFLISLLFQ